MNKSTIWPSNTSQDIYPVKIIMENDTCTPNFTAVLFTIVRKWKQPRCPTTDEWIKKMWYIYTMEYYSAIKRNGFESVIVRWMNLELSYGMNESEREKQILYVSASVVSSSVRLWTVACQAPLSVGFSRQEHWSGLSFPSPGDLTDPGVKPTSPRSPALAGGFFTTSANWEAP